MRARSGLLRLQSRLFERGSGLGPSLCLLTFWTQIWAAPPPLQLCTKVRGHSGRQWRLDRDGGSRASCPPPWVLETEAGEEEAMGSVELGKGLLETSYGDNLPHAL